MRTSSNLWTVVVLLLMPKLHAEFQNIGPTPGDVMRVLIQPAAPPGPPFELVITNIGSKPVSGYRIRFDSYPGDPNAGELIEELVPSFPAVGRSSPGRYTQVGPIMPGETSYRPYSPAEGANNRLPLPVVKAVVFTDGTGVGDEESVVSFFDTRRGMADGFGRALELVREGRSEAESIQDMRQQLLLESQGRGNPVSDFHSGRATGLQMAALCLSDILGSSATDQQTRERRLDSCVEGFLEKISLFRQHSKREGGRP